MLMFLSEGPAVQMQRAHWNDWGGGSQAKVYSMIHHAKTTKTQKTPNFWREFREAVKWTRRKLWRQRFCPAFNMGIQNMYDLCLGWVRLDNMSYILVCFKYTEPFRVLALCWYLLDITAAQGVFLTTQLCCCTWTGELLSAVLVQQVIVASQCPWAVVVCPKAQEDVPVEGIVVLQRESVKELEERLWQDEVPCVPHLKRGHGQNLVHPQKLGILQKEREEMTKKKKQDVKKSIAATSNVHTCTRFSTYIFVRTTFCLVLSGSGNRE